jgi:hypothetical protein
MLTGLVISRSGQGWIERGMIPPKHSSGKEDSGQPVVKVEFAPSKEES